jgi:hypothetical protein
MKTLALFLCMIVLGASFAKAGLVAYGLCQSRCAGLVVACYAGAVFVFGTVIKGVNTPPDILNCNKAFGKCSSTCSSVTLN